MQKEHLWVGRSKGATPTGGRRAIKGTAHSNIHVAGWVGRSKAVTPAGGRRAIKGTAHSNICVTGWVGRSKAVTPAGGRQAIKGATHSNISVAGVPQPDLGEAVVSSRYSNDISSIFLSESSFTQSSQVLMVGRPADGQAGKLLPNKGGSRSRALG